MIGMAFGTPCSKLTLRGNKMKYVGDGIALLIDNQCLQGIDTVEVEIPLCCKKLVITNVHRIKDGYYEDDNVTWHCGEYTYEIIEL